MRSNVDGRAIGSRKWSSGTLVVRIVKDGPHVLDTPLGVTVPHSPRRKKRGGFSVWPSAYIQISYTPQRPLPAQKQILETLHRGTRRSMSAYRSKADIRSELAVCLQMLRVVGHLPWLGACHRLVRRVSDKAHVLDHALAQRADGSVSHGSAPVLSEVRNPKSQHRTDPPRYPEDRPTCRYKLPRERFSPLTRSGHSPHADAQHPDGVVERDRLGEVRRQLIEPLSMFAD